VKAGIGGTLRRTSSPKTGWSSGGSGGKKPTGMREMSAAVNQAGRVVLHVLQLSWTQSYTSVRIALHKGALTLKISLRSSSLPALCRNRRLQYLQQVPCRCGERLGRCA